MPNIPPFILIFLGALILMVWWFFGREKIGQTFPNPLLKKYKKIPRTLLILWGIRCMIFILSMTLWSDLSFPLERRIRDQSGKNIILALDISASMRADDIEPSRLDRAKEVIEDFLRQDRQDAIGYVIFAGKTFLLSPPSHDRAGIQSLVHETTIHTIDQSAADTSGTNIGDALIASIASLDQKKEDAPREKIIILITDGRANIGISPLIAADEAGKNNIRIYTVGIGSSSGGALSYKDEHGIRQYFYSQKGTQIIADRDEATLRAIAEKTGGRYFHAENIELLESIFRELDASIGSPTKYSTAIHTLSLSPFFALSILVLMIFHGFLGLSLRRKYKTS